MCEICKSLVECPVDHKRIVQFAKDQEKVYPNVNGVNLYSKPWEIRIDKFEDHTVVAISQDTFDDRGMQYGGGFDGIKYCPFCGQQLV